MSSLPDDGTDHLESFANKELPALGPKNVKAERAVWMSRTSDIHGQFTKTDIDSYLALIRRKVQEKCNTIQDLMMNIRKNKINNSNHVTPNEFRYTLIKFGIILPQPLVDNVFRIFDSDRSGTMDFDEFAMWIMNSEFQPHVVDSHGDVQKRVSPEERLRLKLKAATEAYPQVWKVMKRSVNFMELVSDVNRFDMKLTEKDVRSLFLMFDQGDTGFIESAKLRHWAATGFVPRTPTTAEQHARLKATSVRPDLQRAIFAICGRSTNLLSDCFSHFPVGEGVMIAYDEFRRCLLSRGLGKPKDSKALFFALGGEPGGRGRINVDDLLNHLPSKELILQNSGTAPTHRMPERALVPVSRADRALRDALRKRFKFIQGLFHRSDPSNTGYLRSNVVHKIINDHVLPLTYEDFRHIMKNVMHDEDQNLNYNHILQMYNPMKAPHILDGAKSASATASEAVLQTMRESSLGDEGAESTSAPMQSVEPASTPDKGEMRRNWQSVLRECQKEDASRSGLVLRETFVDAVAKSGLKKTFGAATLSEMADQFTVKDGKIDYLSCFRSYLNGMVAKLPNPNSPTRFRKKGVTEARSVDGNHPWDYGYIKERASNQPYWLNSTIPKDMGDMRRKEGTNVHLPNGTAPSPDMKVTRKGIMSSVQKGEMATPSHGGDAISDAARVGMLRGLDKAVIGTCLKCNRVFLPIWRELRGEFKRNQHGTEKGYIATSTFSNVLEAFGVRLAGSEISGLSKAFGPKGKSKGAAIKFDDFMRVCLVASPDVCRAAGM